MAKRVVWFLEKEVEEDKSVEKLSEIGYQPIVAALCEFVTKKNVEEKSRLSFSSVAFLKSTLSCLYHCVCLLFLFLFHNGQERTVVPLFGTLLQAFLRFSRTDWLTWNNESLTQSLDLNIFLSHGFYYCYTETNTSYFFPVKSMVFKVILLDLSRYFTLEIYWIILLSQRVCAFSSKVFSRFLLLATTNGWDRYFILVRLSTWLWI